MFQPTLAPDIHIPSTERRNPNATHVPDTHISPEDTAGLRANVLLLSASWHSYVYKAGVPRSAKSGSIIDVNIVTLFLAGDPRPG
jgi:hypothetical protein